MEQLTQVKGIGRWTAQMFLIFSLGRPDAFPHDDLGVRTAIRDRYGLAELPDKATSHAIAAPWRPWASGGQLVLLAVTGPDPEHEDRGQGVSDVDATAARRNVQTRASDEMFRVSSGERNRLRRNGPHASRNAISSLLHGNQATGRG